MVEAIRDHLVLGRPSLRIGLTMTPIAAKVAARIAGEDVGLIEPLMESLESDLLPRDEACAGVLRRAHALLRQRGGARARGLGAHRGAGGAMTPGSVGRHVTSGRGR
jgi:hypothetical protein